MVCIHADVGEAEWEVTEDHARSQAEAFGIPFLVFRAHDKSGNDKALIDYIDARGQFPSRSSRFCTSNWKRGPIRRTINAYRRQINHQSPYVLNCMGMRSQERRSEEHTSELQSLMRISYAVLCLKKKKKQKMS